MKTLKLGILSFFVLTSLNANNILDNTSKDIFESKKQKGDLESNLLKNSWINSLNLQADLSKSKTAGSEDTFESKKYSIGFNQDIFRSGGIYQTIQKGKAQNRLNKGLISKEEKLLISNLYSYVIDMRKIDLQIKKLYFLITNQEIEITKKESLYTNGLVDISDLD